MDSPTTTDTTPPADPDATAALLEQIRNAGASSSSSPSEGANVTLAEPADAETADYIAALEERIAELEGHPGEARPNTGDGGEPTDAATIAQVPAGDPYGADRHHGTDEPSETAEQTAQVARDNELAAHLDAGNGEPTEAAEVDPQVPVGVGAE